MTNKKIEGKVCQPVSDNFARLKDLLMYIGVVMFTEGGPADMAGLDSQEISSLSDNIDSTDDLVPSLQVNINEYHSS